MALGQSSYLAIIFFIFTFDRIVLSIDSKNVSSLEGNEIEYAGPDVLNSEIEDEGGGRGKENSNGGLLRGKVLTEVKIHPNGSAVSVGNEHWDNIVSTLLSQKRESNVTTEKNRTKTIEKEDGNYTCIKCDEHVCDKSELCYEAVQCFTARRRDSTGTETYSRGCIATQDQITFICSASFHMQVEALAITCCSGHHCNNESYPVLPNPSGDISNIMGLSISADMLYDKNAELIKLIYVVLGTLIFIILLVVVMYIFIARYLFKQNGWPEKGFPTRSNLNPFSSVYKADKFISTENSTSMLNESLSSGSGSGLPLFVQRTLAKNIYLEDLIGKGRYSEVWKGLWNGEAVAVKIFPSRDEATWARETEIYSILLRHNNILCFYGSDKTCRASCTQLWLVTHYYPNGSLHNYLRTHVLNHKDLFNICLSIINGLLHLHTAIMGTQGKPAIAHRDLNSNNILVKNDGTCCISDFGLSVFRTSGTEDIDLSNSDRSGTKRYMSPEILDGSIDVDNFDCFRKADIYGVALVMWEACRRCLCNGIAEEYMRPYENIFLAEPSYEGLQKYVCIQGGRPPIPNRWADDKILSSMDRLLNECWHENPNVRLTSLRIKKNLLKITVEESKDDYMTCGNIV